LLLGAHHFKLAESIAQPKNAALAAQVATVFKGETLRGLLLNATPRPHRRGNPRTAGRPGRR
jgi:hypothetical protein